MTITRICTCPPAIKPCVAGIHSSASSKPALQYGKGTLAIMYAYEQHLAANQYPQVGVIQVIQDMSNKLNVN